MAKLKTTTLTTQDENNNNLKRKKTILTSSKITKPEKEIQKPLRSVIPTNKLLKKAIENSSKFKLDQMLTKMEKSERKTKKCSDLQEIERFYQIPGMFSPIRDELEFPSNTSQTRKISAEHNTPAVDPSQLQKSTSELSFTSSESSLELDKPKKASRKSKKSIKPVETTEVIKSPKILVSNSFSTSQNSNDQPKTPDSAIIATSNQIPTPLTLVQPLDDSEKMEIDEIITYENLGPFLRSPKKMKKKKNVKIGKVGHLKQKERLIDSKLRRMIDNFAMNVEILVKEIEDEKRIKRNVFG